MSWRKNQKRIDQGFADLVYLPRGRCAWDCTLASLAFGIRRQIEHPRADLNAWAARHGLPGSARWAELGEDAWVLWHGTSRPRAQKIAQHGLFSKRGLWATFDPHVSHSFCRGRADRYQTDGAVVCIVIDQRQFAENRDYQREDERIIRFHHGLPPDVVQYVLLHDQIQFTGRRRAAGIAPWMTGQFLRRGGAWVPVQRPPVRYSADASYDDLEQFARLTIQRLLAELDHITALEVFSTLYATVRPWDALEHERILQWLADCCEHGRLCGRYRTWRTAQPIPSAV